MRAIDLNLATRPFKNNTLLWVGYLLAFVLLGLFTAWNAFTWREHIDKLAELQDTVQLIEGRNAELDRREAVAAKGIKGYDLETLAIQADKANEVIEWKAFSWTRLFNKMEQVQPYNVRLTSIRPLFSGGERRSILKALEGDTRQSVAVAVEGTAKNFGAFWEMQNALLTDEHFGQIDPERLNKNESREIVFQLSFLYFPEADGTPQEAVPDEASKAAAADEGGAPEEAADDAAGQQAEEPVEQPAAEVAEREQPPAEAVPAPETGSPPESAAEEAAEEAAEKAPEEKPEDAPRGTRFAKAKRRTKGRRR